MDQNYNSSQNDFLWTLLANPADDAYQYNYNLQRLVNDFPQSGILQALLAHSSEEKNLKQAAVYFNAKSLYKLINAPSSFIGVAGEKIIVQNGSRPVSFNGHVSPNTNNGGAENYFSDNTPAETDTAADDRPEIEDEITQHVEGDHVTGAAAGTWDNNPSQSDAENHHGDALHEHEPVMDTSVVGQPIDTIEEVPESEIAGRPTVAAEPGIGENAFSEVKDELVDDAAAAEPIINYASGLGHRLPAEPEPADEIDNTFPPPADIHVEEDQMVAHQIAPDISYEHSVEENINDAHLAPPVTEESFLQPHPADAEMPPPVPAEHMADPVAAEYKDFEEPPAHENEQAGEQPVTEQFSAAGYENDEPVQQYRPWDEPVAEAHQPEAKDDAIEAEQPAEEYKPWEAAAGHQQPAPGDELIQAEPLAIEEDTWKEGATAGQQPDAKEEHLETQAEERKPWEAPITEAHQPESHNIEEETFDEITGNIDVEQAITGNMAATDHFGFDRAFGEHKEPEPVKQDIAAATEPVNEQPGDDGQQDLSRYHDEKMPYSFLWWLDKTRKEHSGVYQPYVPSAQGNTTEKSARPKPGTDELQQQYYENIFHITSVDELDKSLPQPPYAAPPAFSEKKKEQLIIERFIQEEPQIRPQSSDKLDNENKAKKSSEDRDELVSETLAAIYSDQMLYHKAIASYKKLMLRFPEKSRYFAAKIEQLEKKTN